MIIEKVKFPKEVMSNYEVAQYSKEDIENLIKADLKSKGYEQASIHFKATTKYETDEWGMNIGSFTEFSGVSVVLEIEDEHYIR